MSHMTGHRVGTGRGLPCHYSSYADSGKVLLLMVHRKKLCNVNISTWKQIKHFLHNCISSSTEIELQTLSNAYYLLSKSPSDFLAWRNSNLQWGVKKQCPNAKTDKEIKNLASSESVEALCLRPEMTSIGGRSGKTNQGSQSRFFQNFQSKHSWL